MEINNYLRLNPQKCEQYLSPFGKKVLGELMKRWATEREQKKQHDYRQFSQNRRILNFNDNSIRNTSTTLSAPQSPPLQMYIEDSTSNIILTDVIAPNIPTTEDLTTSLQAQENIDSNDFLHPTVVSSNMVQSNSDYDEKGYDHTNKKVDSVVVRNMDRNETLGINWENMFDSELLDDIANDLDNRENRINTNISNVPYSNENAVNHFDITSNKEEGRKATTKRKSKIGNSKNTKQSKKDTIKLNDGLKKVDKVNTDCSKISYRKEKYTKTVKKWLDDVEPYKIIDKELDTENNQLNFNKENIDIFIQNDDKTNIDKRVPVKASIKVTANKPAKDNKKVIQAQLANKDGVMKFAKPKKIVANENEVLKDKKDRAAKKFVPPIKSLIPVEDVTYQIITIDDNNVEECCDALINGKEEINVVLIYSNGFCQLNSHFTDGTCSAEGVLFGTGDIFYCFKGTSQKLKLALTRVFASNKLLIGYEARTILIYLASYLQIDLKIFNMYDAKIGASLLDPDNSPENFSEFQKLLSFTPPYTIATECTLQKAAWYMTLLKDCWCKLKDVLVENQLWQVFVQIEMKLLPIIAEMEHRGVALDLSKLRSMEEMLQTRMKLVEQECYKAAGKVFQINSTLQVRNIIYDELQLDAKCNVKVRETLSGGVKSTSETMLRSLMAVHPLPKLILEYRHLHKAHATFLAGIAQQVKDGIVRPTWVQTAAATGRIASNNPNLQAIPKTPFSLVMFPDGDQANDAESLQLNFRSVYISRPGCTFVAADFKHVECRVFAHAAADTGLLHALTHSDDLFKVLSAQWLKKPENTVTTSERERTKRLVYASLYGAGTRKLMEILEVSYEQALQVAASFNRTFPSLKSFGRHVVSQCSQAGGRLSTICGRVRHFANISSKDFNLRSHAERQAVNFIIQGSAADLCKIAMILTEEQLRSTVPRVQARLVLQIHDELVWEVVDQHVHVAAGVIKRVMEGCGQQCGMSMSLPVAVTVGKNWGEMKDYIV